MIDGTVARRTGSDGKLGSQLDTAADLVFVAVSFGKLLPTVHVPCWLWVWGGAIAMVKIGTILWGCISKKQFVSHHTAMNKITGFLLFLTPLAFSFAELQYSAAVVCAVATVAAIQESFYVITDPT